MEGKQGRNREQIESEFGGRTIEEALEKALAVLKVDRSELDVKVLSEEEKGLFGMEGGKLARIRVTLKKN